MPGDGMLSPSLQERTPPAGPTWSSASASSSAGWPRRSCTANQTGRGTPPATIQPRGVPESAPESAIAAGRIVSSQSDGVSAVADPRPAAGSASPGPTAHAPATRPPGRAPQGRLSSAAAAPTPASISATRVLSRNSEARSGPRDPEASRYGSRHAPHAGPPAGTPGRGARGPAP